MPQSTESRLDPLLSRWEELRDQGQMVSAEELCHDCPELAPELKRRIEALRAVDSVLTINMQRTPAKRVEPRLEDDVRPLLRSRLLFLAAANLAIGILILAMLVSDDGLAGFGPARDIFLQFGVCGLSLVILIALMRGRFFTLHKLRVMEVIMFALASVLLASAQYRWYHSGWLQAVMKQGKERETVQLAGSGLTSPWMLLILVYGTCIPSTGRRCAVMVSGIALTPVALMLVLGLQDEALGPHLFREVLAANMLVWLTFASALAVFGSRRLAALRREVLAARKLGQYRLLRRLGAGGMGEVYLAEHQLLRRPCAVKLIRLDRAGDAGSLQRFEREVQAMATLKHWNTVEIYDYGHNQDGTFYYVMEYLPGMDLQTLVDRHGPLPAARAVHLLRQVCAALHEAHDIGLVHRDIKPSNIILCERGGVYDVVKLLDFGLVTSVRSPKDARLTQEGFIVGTPLYMSPEQATGTAKLDGRSDIYSVGAVAYFLLTGQPVFVRESVIEVLIAHQSVAAPSLRGLREDVPDDVQAVVLRCLEKSPAQRIQDAASLDQSLRQCPCADQWSQADAAAWWRDHGAALADRVHPSSEITASISQ